jgi:hypothetical protein
MRHAVRTTLLALASVLALLVPGTSPASASGGAGAWEGTAYIDCFGCGVSHGTADVCAFFVGAGGQAGLCLPVHATFTVNEPTATCPFQGSAVGTMSGGPTFSANFAWTRVGMWAVMTTTGTVNGAGPAGFVPKTPGLPCGGPVEAYVWGSFGGS